MRAMKKNLLLLAGGLLLAALLLEGGARILSLYRPASEPAAPIDIVPAKDPAAPSDPASYGPNEGSIDSIHLPDQWVWWKVKPNLRDYKVHIAWDETHSFTLNTTAQGFRATGPQQESPALRILVVGDSTAFGVGVDDADSWPALLEKKLAAALQREVEVVNAGVPGYSTFQALRMAEKYAEEPKPDLLIVCAGFNDSVYTAKGELPDVERAAKNEQDQPQGHASAFVSLVSKAMEGAQRMAPGPERPRLSPEEYRSTLASAETHYATQETPILWVRWPVQDEVVNHAAPSAGYPLLLLEHGGQPGRHMVDLLPPFLAAQPSPYYDFVHATAAGNEVAAGEIARAAQEVISQAPARVH